MKKIKIIRERIRNKKYRLFEVYMNPSDTWEIVKLKLYAKNERGAINRYMDKRFRKEKRHPSMWSSDGWYREITHDFFRKIVVIDEKGYERYYE